MTPWQSYYVSWCLVRYKGNGAGIALAPEQTMVLEDAPWLRHLNCSSCTNSTISRAGSREQMRPSLTGAQSCWAFPLPFLAFLLLLAVFLWWICISSLLVQFQAIVFIWEVISGSPREEQGKGRITKHFREQQTTHYLWVLSLTQQSDIKVAIQWCILEAWGFMDQLHQ